MCGIFQLWASVWRGWNGSSTRHFTPIAPLGKTTVWFESARSYPEMTPVAASSSRPHVAAAQHESDNSIEMPSSDNLGPLDRVLARVTEVWNRRGEELERRLVRSDPALQEAIAAEVLRVAVDLLDEGKLEQAKAGVRGFCYAAIRTDARSATSLVMRAGEGPDVRLGILFSPRQQQAIGAFAALCRQSAKPSDRKTVQPTDRRRRSRPSPRQVEGRLYRAFLRQYSLFLAELSMRQRLPALDSLSRRWRLFWIGLAGMFQKLRYVPAALLLLLLLCWMLSNPKSGREMHDSKAGRIAQWNDPETGKRRFVHANRQGNWWITGENGEELFRAPPSLATPGSIDYLSFGDLTGDGVPELVLGRETHFDLGDAWMSIYTNTASGYRLLDRFPVAPTPYDAALCAEQRRDGSYLQQNSPLDDVRPLRRRCAHGQRAVVFQNGTMFIARNFYARDILAVRCTQQGCAHRRSIFEVASDPHAMFLLPTTPTPLVVIGTGCWSAFTKKSQTVLTPYPYGLLVLSGFDSLRKLSYQRKTGVTTAVPLSTYRLALLSGTPCDGELPATELVSLQPMATKPRTMLQLIDVDNQGAQHVVDETSLDFLCPPDHENCGHQPRISLLRDRSSVPRVLVFMFGAQVSVSFPNERRYLVAYDLGKPLRKQQPVVYLLKEYHAATGIFDVTDLQGGMTARWRSPGLTDTFAVPAAADLDGDGQEDVLVGDHEWGYGTVAFLTAWRSDGALTLTPVPKQGQAVAP